MPKTIIFNALRGFLILVLLFVMPFFTAGAANLRAAPAHRSLRIGLESHFLEQSQIAISSAHLAIGQYIGGHFHISGFLSSHGGFEARPDNNSYITMPQYSFMTMGQAQEAALHHHNAIPGQKSNGMWGLFFPADSMVAGDFAAPTTTRVALWADGRAVLISDTVHDDNQLQIQDTSGITSIGSRQYRGIIEFARFGGNLLTAVNIIDIEEYLLSVVPAEMPASWHMQALKAQAVAARTYTVHRLGSLAHRGYDLCDTTFSQVYLGVASEHENTTYAVNATRGIMIFYDNAPIEAVYFSSSGGVTENSENVWVATMPYLRSVREIHEPGAMSWNRSITLTQLQSALAASNVNIGNVTGLQLDKSATGRVQAMTILGSAGNHTIVREAIRWFFTPSLESRNFTIVGGMAVHGAAASPMAQNVEKAYLQSADGIISANLAGLQAIGQFGGTSMVPHGSVLVQGSAGAVQLQITAPPGQGQQPEQGQQPGAGAGAAIVATVFSAEYTIELSGRGWGHGVGMSQHGAHGMAQMGYDFRQILQHYYTGVTVRN